MLEPAEKEPLKRAARSLNVALALDVMRRLAARDPLLLAEAIEGSVSHLEGDTDEWRRVLAWHVPELLHEQHFPA